MKKYIVLCAGLCLALGMTSCKSSESAYKKAYEKAKQYDTQTPQQTAQQTYQEPAVVAPVQTVATNEARQVDNYDNVTVRQEKVSVVSGNGLKRCRGFLRSAVECRGFATALEECWLCSTDCEERRP